MFNTLIANIQYQRRKLFYPKSAQGQRAAIMKVVKARKDGATRDEIVVATGIPLQSVTWRVRELISRKFLLTDEFRFRPTRLGVMASVLKVA